MKTIQLIYETKITDNEAKRYLSRGKLEFGYSPKLCFSVRKKGYYKEFTFNATTINIV